MRARCSTRRSPRRALGGVAAHPGLSRSGRRRRAALLASTTGFRARLIAMPLDSVQARLGAVGRRLAFGLGWVASFAVRLARRLPAVRLDAEATRADLALLLVVVVIWLTSVVLRFILAPGAVKFRVLPVSTASARHWHFWLTLIVGWYTGSRLTVWFLDDLGVSDGGAEPLRRSVLPRLAGAPAARHLAPAGLAGRRQPGPGLARPPRAPTTGWPPWRWCCCGSWYRSAPTACSARP